MSYSLNGNQSTAFRYAVPVVPTPASVGGVSLSASVTEAQGLPSQGGSFMTAAVPQQQLMGASKASFQPNMAPRFGFDPITMTAGALALKGLAIGALAFAWHAITTAALVIGGCCVGATGLIAAAATAPKWWPALTKMFKA